MSDGWQDGYDKGVEAERERFLRAIAKEYESWGRAEEDAVTSNIHESLIEVVDALGLLDEFDALTDFRTDVLVPENVEP